MGESVLKGQMILCMVLALLSSIAPGVAVDATGAESDLNILGSTANNSTVIIPEGASVGVDILGSTADNLRIDTGARMPEPPEEIHECSACGEEKLYVTPWDDFTRPLCYPWSSYIPTRYNRNFIRQDMGYMETVPGTLSLGQGKSYA